MPFGQFPLISSDLRAEKTELMPGFLPFSDLKKSLIEIIGPSFAAYDALHLGAREFVLLVPRLISLISSPQTSRLCADILISRKVI